MNRQKIQRYGWRPQLPDNRDLQLLRNLNSTNLPPLVDLRPNCPAIYDQGDLGSCTANAIAAAIQFDAIKQGLPSNNPSRLFIYYNERVIEGIVKIDGGAQLRNGIKVVSKLGVCDEVIWPYNISKFKNKPSKKAFNLALAQTALLYEAIDGTNLNLIKQVLSGGYPISFGFTVYESFESVAVEKTGMLPMPLKTEQVLGGHAVGIYGYDDSKQCVLVRNSWGNSWGIGGYFYMPYAYVTNPNLTSDFWKITNIK